MCNVSTNAGCEDGEECFTTDALYDAEEMHLLHALTQLRFYHLGRKNAIQTGIAPAFVANTTWAAHAIRTTI